MRFAVTPRSWLSALPLLARTGLLASALALAAPSSAAELALPELGDASAAIVSPAEERQLGEQIIRAVHRGLPISDDAVLQFYTENLLGELVAASELDERSVRVVVVESPDLNAFAAPGNIVAVNLGLFLYAQNVHEFSSVLAHELAHLSQRHFARGVEYQRKATLPYIAAMLASIAIMATTGSDAGLAALTSTQAAATDNRLRFSRSREQEADRIGLATLQRAGFDPHGMSGMFERMAAAFRYREVPPEFLLSHPVTESRIADARNQASGAPHRSHLDRDDYQFARCRARIAVLSTAEAAVQYAEEQGKAQPSAAASDYCLALAYGRAHRHAAADAALRALRLALPNEIYVDLLEVELAREAGFHAEAARLSTRGLTLHPDNRAFALEHARALTRLGQPVEAARVLQRQTQLRPADARLWYELAETAGLAGEIRTLHLARAEFFQLTGRYDDALKQLDYAQKATVDDPRTSARIADRVRDVETMKEDYDG